MMILENSDLLDIRRKQAEKTHVPTIQEVGFLYEKEAVIKYGSLERKAYFDRLFELKEACEKAINELDSDHTR